MSAAQPDERLDPSPDFLVLGAQKAGTSWLHARLREQPGFWLPADKDDEYFSYPGASPPADFHARFAAAPAATRIGDACASYFWTTGHSEANPGFARDLPGTIDAALGPDAKYIVLLRDPIERALSAYLHHIAFGSLDPATPLLEAPEALGLVEIGRYGHHLEAWLDRVGEERLCVLPAPGERPPCEVLDRAVRFLGGGRAEAPDDDAPVFEGTPRRRDHAGVWAPVGAPGLADASGPRVESGGRHWVRVVDPATLDALAAELAPDRARLRRQLARAGVEADWVERWIGPGRTAIR
ncbi:sulfotransferase [Wenzhouxiangella sp. XN79A]|uniref:sulfotransferase n=1 Tax=Wenzhouxiangella sp. XN79A TaxID=2724193 RepID=UPI00144A94B8|nr:sulfotransferase [Wenzhouxiangella sp. XN79A]NKI35292.1 sulfotransferase [Wenzhouxiangella sp. XN79A]